MRKSDSTDTLEETLEISQKIQSNERKRQILRKSFSEDLPKFETEELPTTPPPSSSNKIKSRSRFSSAFRSLRRSKSSGKKSSSTSAISKFEKDTLSGDNLSLERRRKSELEKLSLSPDDSKKKLKLSKKFSLGGIRKQKLSSSKVNLQHILVSSSTQTPSTLQRQTPEGGNLSSISQVSLIDFPSDSEEPVKFEKVRKIQITISGKKIIDRAQRNQSATTTSITGEDYLTVSAEPPPPPPPPLSESNEKSNPEQRDNDDCDDDNNDNNKTTKSDSDIRRQQEEKISVTESTRDTPPRERAPARPNINSSTRIETDSINRTTKESQLQTRAHLDGAGAATTGAIRKSSHPKLQRQRSREQTIESGQFMQYENNLNRGRRFPRPSPIDHSSLPESQQVGSTTTTTTTTTTGNRENILSSSNPLGGNNLQNPNLSGAISDRPLESTELSQTEQKIEFSVGKEVRPQKASALNQISTESKEYSSLGSNKSSGSQSPVSEGSLARRRIRYIDQPTFYTDEEQEILEGKREALGHLSGISEYSFDSELSTDTHMPAFGDLTMDHEDPPIMTSSSAEKREHLYKILVIGELGTGKTSFIKRYVHQFFSQNYRATIGVDFALKVLHWDQNTIVRLQLWDIAGQERFGNMTRVYYKEAVGAFIVFDVTRSGTFDCVTKWKEDLDSKVQLPDGNPIPCILLANKCDQEKQGIVTNPDKMDEYVREKGFAGWYETSAKENINIEDAARALVNKILLNDKLISAADLADSDKFGLAGSSGGGSMSPTKRTCSC